MTFRVDRKKKKSAIAIKLVMRAIIAGFVASILASSFQLYFKYQYRYELAEDNITQIGTTFLPSLSQSLWSFDIPQLRLNLQTIARQQYISSVKLILEDETEPEFFGTEVESSNFIEKRFDVAVTNPRNETTNLGTLILVKDFQEEVDDLLIDSLYTFIGNTMIIIVIAITITQIFQVLVTRRLTSIASRWGSISEKDLREGLGHTRFKSSGVLGKKDTDELDTLEHVIELLFRTGATALQEAEEKEKTLIKLKVEADAANTAKSEFLANMSHEIRTPMNGVAGLAELLQQTHLSDSQQNLVTHIRSSSSHLLEIINDILDFSKIEADQMEIALKKTDLDVLVSDLAISFSSVSMQKNIEWVCPASPPLNMVVMADEIRIRQVLTNLIGNAVKFTESGEVSVSCQCVHKSDRNVSIRFTVQDSGIGIPEKNQANLFERFTQADNSSRRAFGGTGLGLAICKKLVTLMGGEISFTSSPKGSKFWFELPLTLCSETPSDVTDKADLDVVILSSNQTQLNYLSAVCSQLGIDSQICRQQSDFDEWLSSEVNLGQDALLLIDESWTEFVEGHLDRIEAMAQKRNAAQRTVLMTQDLLYSSGSNSLFDLSLSKPVQPTDLIALLQAGNSEVRNSYRSQVSSQTYFDSVSVLLVEDNRVNQLVAEKMLQKLGVSYRVAHNGLEALSQLQEHQFDLIFMDCQMPQMDGYEATEAIRKGQSGRNSTDIPIIALTANALTGDRAKCLASGMNDHVAKPVSLSKFKDVLSRWFADKQVDVGIPIEDQSEELNQDVSDSLANQELGHTGEFSRFDYQKMFDLMMGDEVLVVSVLSAFLDDIPNVLVGIEKHSDAREYSEVGKLAHKIKGAADNLSAYQFRETALLLEKAGKSENKEEVERLLPIIKADFEQLKPLLCEKMSDLN